MGATRRTPCILGAVLFLTLAACGGGGGGSSSGGGGGSTATAPTITQQPISQSVPAGGTATFTVAATGSGVLTYQWYTCNTLEAEPCMPDFGLLTGATAATLSVPGNSGTAVASYYCVVTNTLNGTKATATSNIAGLNVVEPTITAAITAASAVLPNTAGLVASVVSQAGVTYTWTVSNGTITAGQGTRQITYTSGGLGTLQITATLSGPATGTVVGVQNVVVVSTLPIVSIFAQSSVLPGATGVLASTPAAPDGTYGWTLQNGTASASIVGSSALNTLTYNVGTTPGSYQISVDVSDQAGSGSAAQTLAVVQGTFLKDVRDMAQRSLHTATLLNDGRVLFAGGDAGLPGFDSTTGLPSVGADSNIVAAAELFDPVTTTWAVVGPLTTARALHKAIRLDDGRVLVVGGVDATNTALASVEIYDPMTQSWSPGPPMSTARELPSVTLLANGQVLVSGGANATGVLGTAEIYDSVANAWSGAGTMVSPRVLHSATLLANGQVLAVAGLSGVALSGETTSTELYNPATNSWSAAAPLPQAPPPAFPEGAVLLPSGQVLELGANAQIYDPATNSWQPSVSSSVACCQPTATGVDASTAIVLPNGRVLAVGSMGNAAASVGNGGAAVYDPIMQSWGGTTTPAALHEVGVTGSNPLGVLTGGYGSVTGLQDGRVLADGGIFAFGTPANSVSTTALYDPTQNSWFTSGSQAHAGYYAASGVLANGQVLVTGGSVLQGSGLLTALTTADVFNPSTDLWTAAAPMSTTRQQHTATALPSGDLLVTGGNYGSGYAGVSNDVLNSAELYNPTTNTWSSAGTMSSPRYEHTASLLANGMVLVAGGNNLVGTCSCTTFVSSADLYNPATNSFTATGALLTARYAHTATVLANGMVLVAGGFGGATSTLQSGGAPLASAELYNPTTGAWTATGSMTTARMNHTATLLPSGEVLVAGGYTGTATTATAELYSPTTGTWTAVASMSTPRQSQGAALLSNGTVLIVGGLNDTSSAVIGVGTAEVYDPTANTWTVSGAMVTTRQFFVLNTLGDGRILLDGGSPNAFGLPEFYK
jgi:N-acetylneuraminic acid mutarotase